MTEVLATRDWEHHSGVEAGKAGLALDVSVLASPSGSEP